MRITDLLFRPVSSTTRKPEPSAPPPPPVRRHPEAMPVVSAPATDNLRITMPRPEKMFLKDDHLFRNAESEGSLWTSGEYVCVRLAGKYSEDLATAVRTKVFSKRQSVAIELGALTNIPPHFAREIYFAARQRRDKDQRLVLVKPPAYLVSLLKLISEDCSIPTVTDFSQITGDGAAVDHAAEEIEKTHATIRGHLQTNPLWQYVDRESCWVCPHCGRTVEDAKFSSRLNISRSLVERVYEHIQLRCPKYNPNRVSGLDRTGMESAVKQINSQKYSVSQERTQELQTLVTRLEEKSKRADEMEQDLKVAAERQKHLLPTTTPLIPDTDMALVYRAASQISGDFYDFFDLPDGRKVFMIGDVSGHGIEAAILMGMTKKVLQLRVSESDDLRAAVLRANDDIHREMGRKSFVTALVAVYDPARRTLTYVRAGHNPILLVNPARSPSFVQLEPPGTILGMASSKTIDRAMGIEETLLQSGDLLLFYTDGLEEGRNRQDEMFGRERIIEILQSNADRATVEVLGSIELSVGRFIGNLPQEDDITMIGMRIL